MKRNMVPAICTGFTLQETGVSCQRWTEVHPIPHTPPQQQFGFGRPILAPYQATDFARKNCFQNKRTGLASHGGLCWVSSAEAPTLLAGVYHEQSPIAAKCQTWPFFHALSLAGFPPFISQDFKDEIRKTRNVGGSVCSLFHHQKVKGGGNSCPSLDTSKSVRHEDE